MSDNHSVRVNIDASGATRGATEYVRAITQITNATKTYQKAVESLGNVKTKADFSKMAKDLAAFGNIKISSSTARNLNELSAAMRSFRGPSATAIKGARDFIKLISTASVNTSAVRGIAAAGSAFGNFKGPSRAAAANVQGLMAALSSARIDGQTATQLAAITSSLSGFKGPSAAAVRNINGLVLALNNLKTPPNLNGLTRMLTSLSNVSSGAARSTRSLMDAHRGNTQGMRAAGTSALQLTGNMRGLENAMSVSYQLGSQLRVLFGSLTFAEFTRGVYNATLATQRFNSTIGITAGSASEASDQIAFATNMADKYGLSLEGVYNEYGKFTTAAKLAGQSTEEVQYIFESMSGAMRVMGTDAQGQERVFRALTQMFSKGAVRAEELNSQLGEQIPAAFNLMQEAISEQLGKPVDLAKMLELGQVDDSAVVLLAKKIQEKFGTQVANAMQRADASIGRLSNSWFKFQALVGESGVQDAIGDVASTLADLLDSSDFQSRAADLAKGLGDAIRMIGDAAAYALTHVDELKSVLIAFLSASAARTVTNLAVSIGTTLTQSIVGVTNVLRGATAGARAFSLALGGIPMIVGAAAGALAYFWDSEVKVGEQSLTVGDLVTEAFYNMGESLWDAVKNFDLTSMTSFSNVQANGTASASATSLAWINAFKTMGAAAVTWMTQSGKGFEKIFSAAKAYGGYLANRVKGVDEGTATKSMVDSYFGDTKELDAKYDELKKGVEKLFGVEDASADGVAAAWTKVYEEETKKLAEQAAARKMIREKEAAEAEQKRKEQLAKLDTSGPVAPDLSKINPIRGGDASEEDTLVGKTKSSVEKRLKDAAVAARDYRVEVLGLTQALNAGTISLDEFNAGLEYQNRELQKSKDPYAAMTREMKNDIALSGMATKAREVEIDLRQRVNELAEKGVYLNQAQTASLRKLIEEQQKMNNRPLKDWMDGIEDVGVATDRIMVQGFEGAADEIASFVATGKADIASLAQSILKEFIKVGMNQLYKQLFGDIYGGTKTAPEIKLSTPAASAEQASGQAIADVFKDTKLRDGFGTTGAPEIQAQTAALQASEAGLTQLNSSTMTLRGSLDALGSSTDNYATKVPTLTTNIDTLTTSSINAAEALNKLAGVAGGSPVTGTTPESAYMQPMPGVTAKGAVSGAAAEASASAANVFANTGPASSIALPASFKGADPKQLAAALSSRLQQDFGLTDFQAAGAVGNLAHETAGFKHLQEINPLGGGRGGYGLAQWTGPRRRQFEAFAKNNGMALDSPETNYQFLKHELQTSEKGSIAALRQTTSLQDATHTFDRTFERSGVKNYASRERYAEMAMNATPQNAAMMQPDTTATNSIQQLNTQVQQLGTTAQQATTQVTQQKNSTQQLAQTQQMSSTQTQVAATQYTNAGVQVGISGQQAANSASGFTQAGQAIEAAGQQAGQGAQAASSGLGQLTSLAGMIPGAGQYTGFASQLFSLFGMKEGGISDSPSGFQKMPHFKEGTPNVGTNGQGGIPSVLHPNEAVIPLSRGRKVAVDLGDDSNQGSKVLDKRTRGVAPSINVSIVTPDANSFNKSKRQVTQTMASAYQASQVKDG